MEEKIKVSIIIPVYNVEKYLKRCLDSVINQTLKEIEIICINDGSTDNSLEILKEYKEKDSRITIIDKPNEGISIARNLGIDTAKGEYIGFLDSDDWIDLDYYEKLYNSAIKNNADIAVAEILWIIKFHKKAFLNIDKEIVVEDFEQKLQKCNVPDKSYCCNKIYKLEELKKHNLYFEPGRIYEDVIFTPKTLFYLNRLVLVPDVCYYYFKRSKSLVTIKSEKTKKDLAYAKDCAEKFCKEHNVDINKYITKIKTYKFLGINVFRILEKEGFKTYRIFNIIKWTNKKTR